MPNKQGQFYVKLGLFFRYVNNAIFVLVYFAVNRQAIEHSQAAHLHCGW